MTYSTHCRNGHELTSDNIRRRPDRPGTRECLTCYRASIARRVQAGKPTDPLSNRARMLRNRTRLMGLTMVQRGATIAVSDARGDRLFSGPLDVAEQWAAELFVPNTPGPDIQPIPDVWAPWIEIFTAEQKAGHRSPGTIRTRVGHLVTFARHRPDVEPLTVTRDDLVSYIGGRDDWTARTAHSVRTSFRVFFRLLVDLEHRVSDPARTLPPVSIPRSMPRPCPDHVVQAAFDAIDDDRWRMAARIFVETGMRRAEVARLRSSDVEGRPGGYRLHVIGKGGHERAVPISDDLAALMLGVRTEYLFTGRDGSPMTPGHIGKKVGAALPGRWTVHTLRHRFATMAYQATTDLRAVQELLGHASPATTAIYTKVSDDAMRRAAQAAALDLVRPQDDSM